MRNVRSISYQGYNHLTLNPTNIDLKIPCTVKKGRRYTYDNDNFFQPRGLILRILLFECSTKYKHNTLCSSRSFPLLSFTVNVLICKRIHDKAHYSGSERRTSVNVFKHPLSPSAALADIPSVQFSSSSP